MDKKFFVGGCVFVAFACCLVGLALALAVDYLGDGSGFRIAGYLVIASALCSIYLEAVRMLWRIGRRNEGGNDDEA